MKIRRTTFQPLLIALLACICCGCTKAQAPTAAGAPVTVVSTPAVLATVDSSARGNVPEGASPEGLTVYFHPGGKGVAYTRKEGAGVRLVHEGSVGAPVDSIDALLFSPDGKRIAYSAKVGNKWRMFIDGASGIDSEQTTAPIFSPDSRHVAYGVKTSTGWTLVVDGRLAEMKKASLSAPVFGADSQKIAFTEADPDGGQPRLVICDLSFKTLYSLEGSSTDFTVNSDLSRIASSRRQGGGQSVVEVDFGKAALVRAGARYDSVSNLSFAYAGNNLAYYGIRGQNNYLVLNATEKLLPKGNLPWPPLIAPSAERAALFLESGNNFHLWDARTGGQDAVYEEIGDRAINSGGDAIAYAAHRGDQWFVVLNGKEGEPFDKVVSPKFSPDGHYLVYRARKDGKRFVVVADSAGKVLKQHPAYEMVFPPVFTANGKAVAYGVKDGAQLVWKVEQL